MPKLSQYEIDREANIARNKALLADLELKQAVEELIPSSSKVKAPKTTAKPIQSAKKSKKETEAVAPRRQSTRLRNSVIDPKESPSKKRKHEAELEERRAQENEARLQQEEQARAAKRPRRQNLDIRILGENEEDLSTLEENLKGLTGETRRIGDPEAFVLDDKGDEREMKDLQDKLKKLKIVSRAKVTENRVYSCAYHPEITKDLIFFGDKHGQLGIWDARAPVDEVEDEDGDSVAAGDREGGKYWRLQMHWPATSKSSISCVKVDPANAHSLYMSSYDCSIRTYEFEAGLSREVFALDKILISSFDLTPDGREMWISDAVGGLTHMDIREHKSKAKRFELSEVKIGSVSINPTRPNFLVTASNNRNLKIWDVRSLASSNFSETLPTPPSSPGGPSDNSSAIEVGPRVFNSEIVGKFLESKEGASALRGEWRHNKSVSSAYWDSRGRSIVSTSYDDTLRVWDIASSRFENKTAFPSSRPFSTISHNCQTGRWLTILRAQWTSNPDVYPHFTIGNMNHSLDIYSAKGDLVVRLSDSTKVSAVQAVTASHPNIVERAVSGNGSGRCILWAPSDRL